MQIYRKFVQKIFYADIRIKNQIPSLEFRQKMENSYIGIQYLLCNGVHSIINLIVCIIGTVLIFIKEDKIWIIVVYIFINVLFYFVVTKKLQLKLSRFKKNMLEQQVKGVLENRV